VLFRSGVTFAAKDDILEFNSYFEYIIYI